MWWACGPVRGPKIHSMSAGLPEPLPALPHTAADTDSDAPLQVVKVRRDYNAWVARETLEDYALRYTPERFRRWSHARVSHTAFGAASFLILEAVGATLLVQYGFVNAFWAILATGLVIFLAGWPISVYAARYGVDMDLLTRGAGFGYLGSTITSLIYASFTFIFFALEAAVMAYALELALGVPPSWGYLICSLVVIPLVTHGISAISRLQIWTQLIWLVMLVVPYVFVLWRDPQAFAGVTSYMGSQAVGPGFSWLLFGAALTVGIALITQMGEQADYLRFMPAKTPDTARRWWGAVMLGGPGWVVLGVAKMLGGALLAYMVLQNSVPADRAVDPNQMYLAAYEQVFGHYGWAVAATAVFVVVSQLKINVTNAYAGSLAWSNFFSRLTHSHPGRVVWVVFNTFIAYLLMEMNVFSAIGQVLGLYSNVAIAWMAAVVADLVINKPLGLSPKGIEFKRAHLYDVNPVGVGAMLLATAVSVAAHLGAFGPWPQAFSAVLAMVTALVASPLIAWGTGGRYYLARQPEPTEEGSYKRLQVRQCVICEREYEGPDMAHCPAYRGPICSLCCSLDARCGDLCKPQATVAAQWRAVVHRLLPQRAWPVADAGLAQFVLIMLIAAPLLAALLGLVYTQQLRVLEGLPMAAIELHALELDMRQGLFNAFWGLMLIAGLMAWWLVLAQSSRQVAQEESNRQTRQLNEQTSALKREVQRRREADVLLQQAKDAAEQARTVAEQAQAQAEAANRAKSRYISVISHELRTPLNGILGYAQLMAQDSDVPAHRQQAVAVIRRGGEHLLQLIEGTLDIERIESGRLSLNVAPMPFADTLNELAALFDMQASAKGLSLVYEVQGALPTWVRADEKRLRQIVVNLLGNAVKYTQSGQVSLRVRWQRQMATIEVTDTGPGMSGEALARVFEPFARGDNVAFAPGAGLGLTIAKMLAELMGGELTARSELGAGSTFYVRLFVPQTDAPPDRASDRLLAGPRHGYLGRRRQVLVVDNEAADRDLLQQLLQPLGFEVRTAANGHDALDLLAAGAWPDALLMDLAMPGIDGWQTLRRAKALCEPDVWARTAVAIVSANAFEKPLAAEVGADLGITEADFLTKPLRHSELLDWLERRLHLQWVQATAAVPTAALKPSAAGAGPTPPAADLAALSQALRLGYFRGALQALDALQAAHPQASAVLAHWRGRVQRFEFEAVLDELQRLTPSTP